MAFVVMVETGHKRVDAPSEQTVRTVVPEILTPMTLPYVIIHVAGVGMECVMMVPPGQRMVRVSLDLTVRTVGLEYLTRRIPRYAETHAEMPAIIGVMMVGLLPIQAFVTLEQIAQIAGAELILIQTRIQSLIQRILWHVQEMMTAYPMSCVIKAHVE